MRRRDFLGLVGSLAAVSGCAGGDESVESAVTPASVPTRPDGSTVGGPAEVTAAVVQPGVVAPGDGFLNVVDEAGQYLVVEISGTAPEKSAVEFRFGGASYAPAALERGLYRVGSRGPLYDDDGGTLVFALPGTGDATDTKLIWPDGEWLPSATVASRLEDPLPSFSAALEGPATAPTDGDPRITVRVTNGGSGPGRYVLALNRIDASGPYTPEARLVGELSAGASGTHAIDAAAPERDSSTQYTLDVAGEEARQRHVIAPAGTT